MRVTPGCLRPAESGIEELIEDLAKDILRQENEAVMRLIESRCPYCRYAKTCNPKRGVEGFSIRYGASGDTMACEIGFSCSKGRPRKAPIPFEETRISKIAKGGE